MTLRKSFEQLPDGKKLLASAKLRRQIIRALNHALENSNLTQSDLARELGKTRSAVNQVLTGDGNLKIETVAEYFFAMGTELEIKVKSSNTVPYLFPFIWDNFEEILERGTSTATKYYAFTNAEVVFEKPAGYGELGPSHTYQSVGIAA